MIVLYVLLAATLLARAVGLLWTPLADGHAAVRVDLAVMFVFTGVAHFNRTRADLIRMVPPALPNAPALVTLTGIAELCGAAGLLLPSTAFYAALGLIILLLAMFPANVYAARSAHTIGGRPHTPLPLRTALQIFWIGALWWSVAAMSLMLVTSIGLVAQKNRSGIERVAWLHGCWESVTPQRAIEKQWTAPRGTSMLMRGCTIRNGQLVDHEFVVLREDGDRLAYEAHPAGPPAAGCHSTVVAARRIVLENRKHDFPQRAGYEQTAPDGLTAWIEATYKGAARRLEFVYHRASCSA